MNIKPGSIIEFSSKGSLCSIAAVLQTPAGTNLRILMLNGKETNIPQKKILHYTVIKNISTADKQICRSILKETDEKRKEIANSIDLKEIYFLLYEEIIPYTLQDIAQYLYEPEDEDSYAALLRVLLADKIYFKHKNGQFIPHTENELNLLLKQQEKRKKQEQENAEISKDLAEAEKTGKLTPLLQTKIKEIIKSAVAADTETDISKRTVNILSKNGLADKRKLYKFLIHTKVFKPDENLLLIRYNTPKDFSHINYQQELTIINNFLKIPNQRTDLTHLKTFAIDTPGSKDRDDAFSLVENEDKYTLYIHIADPAEFILPESELDKEALKRSTSIYMPDEKINMLPPQICENLLSLTNNGIKPALTVKATFGKKIDLINFDIFESIIKVDTATDYENANLQIETDNILKKALKLAELLKNKRKELGAVLLARQPELSIKVNNKEIIVEHKNRDELTQGMIAEFMIWANHLAALWCIKNKIPCIFRSQPKPNIEHKLTYQFNPVNFYETLKLFSKTQISLSPGAHGSLGLSSYTQITSPLRRYSDLLIHRQIKAFLNNKPLPYSGEKLSNLLLITKETVAKADEIMKNRENYFLLKYLKLNQFKQNLKLNATIVDIGMNELTVYIDFMCKFKHIKKPSFDIARGQQVKVTINKIDLFEQTISFSIKKQ